MRFSMARRGEAEILWRMDVVLIVLQVVLFLLVIVTCSFNL